MLVAIQPSVDRISRDLESLSYLTLADAPYTRRAFSTEDRRARQLVIGLMRDEAGLDVKVDAAGNIIGRRGGTGPAVMMGSHIDTVRGGGRFDGIAGVVAAIEVARCLKTAEIDPAVPLEVVVFTAEEPSPFGISCIGSRAMTGALDPALPGRLTDAGGRRLDAAIDAIGGRGAKIATAIRETGAVRAFIELHIEQGPRLARDQVPIGLVTDITAIHRGRITIQGRPDHAGTTPMDARRDALAAAAEIILAVESVCRTGGALVGTVGRIRAQPDAANVVPGQVTLEMEMRSHDEAVIEQALSRLRQSIRSTAESRALTAALDAWRSSRAIRLNPALVDRLESACNALGIASRRMPSMAGHDAGYMAAIAPAAMLFIPSRDGRSHCPEEWSDVADVARGAQVMGACLMAMPS